ncbi:MAG TPA: tetratricopeptide repeat protein [Hyphomonadaceae bacterium]|nr:tetratricopeptide repeat protein [Hyphomonadaceae bacterium]
MRTVTLSVLLAASAACVGIGSTQEAPPAQSTPPDANAAAYSAPAEPQWQSDAFARIPGPPLPRRAETAVFALENGDFARAEKILGNVLRSKPYDADANLYMGVVKMNLGKWQDAKKYLEIAVRKMPKHPDPKSRLGVTYAKLGDATGAIIQRAELVRMADTCRGACKDFAPYIAGGIEMIDEALSESAEQG